MKRLLLPFSLLGCISIAQAQLLPVPGGKNPDWVLLKTEARPYDAQALTPPPATDAMPNAAQKSISSIGDHQYYWDAQRQLAYDWVSRGSSKAPFMLVNVREQRKDVVYVYRRATVNGKPNYLPGQRNPTN
ncbi:hypothetical protein Q3A66_01510 [Hymenobacter sp. BT770]|uniref:hypothetical protein n=1 Tax=Hymenobacter sp. BT770 TaxID=2886942 RepID=UPI001D100015|nr:hypothetical protein [Hymenobacter sp. BT770]MCC3151694.1 hypothetical protein [Hymenobacter sp. BT770]MDO3413728.1 hypothetical protein [Hymenobacter sp. BT770]